MHKCLPVDAAESVMTQYPIAQRAAREDAYGTATGRGTQGAIVHKLQSLPSSGYPPRGTLCTLEFVWIMFHFLF